MDGDASDDPPPNVGKTSEESLDAEETPNLALSMSIEASLPDPQNPSSEGSENANDEVEFSDDEYVPYQQEDYNPASLPMPDMTEFDVPLPAELQNAYEEDHQESTSDTTPRPLSSPPSVIHVPDLLKPLESTNFGPSFEGIQIMHLGREAGLTGKMQATYLRLPPGTRTTRMRSYSKPLIQMFRYITSNFRSRCPTSRRQSHILYIRPWTCLAKRVDLSFRCYGCCWLERWNWNRPHDHQ